MKTLVVEAIANGEISHTKYLTDEFIKEYKKINKDSEIDVLNLYDEDIDFLRKETLEKMQAHENNIAKTYVDEFIKYDNVIFAYPFWNLSYPAIIKAYIDYILYTGITFHYTDHGAEGFMTDMKFGFIVSRGGFYNENPSLRHDTLHLKDTLNFIGAQYVGSVEFEGTNVHDRETTIKNREQLLGDVKEFAQKFE